MASSKPPKKEDKGKGVPKKEALDACVTELSTSLQEMTANGETSGQESSANETPLTTCQTDPSRSAPTDGLCHRELYCLLVQVVKDAVGLSERDVWLPAHAWNEDIAVDICESRIGCPVGTYKVQLLSDTEFLLRKRPTSGPEMNWQDANAIIRLISGLFLWCGVPVSLAAWHRSKKEAKYDLDATFAYWHTHAQERTVLSKFRKDSKRSVITLKEPQPQGLGMTRRANKFFAKKMAGGPEREWPALLTVAGSPDGYHSAKDTSDFDDDTEEEVWDVESDAELMDESDNSEASSVWLDRASLHSQRSTTENRNRKRTSQRLKATHSDRATNAKKGIKGRTPDGKKSKVVLSMFQDSKKEGALEYADWRAEVEEYIKKGYEDNKIKDAMLFSLEGKARRNFRHYDEHADLLPAEILKRMDMSYNASVDFWDLNARLCDLKQRAFESPNDYYDHMVDIGVALWGYHQDRFQPGELSHIKKECFFAGLRDQSKYLVSHMKDKREYSPVDMLKELRENDEARYPANTAHRPGKPDSYGQNAGHPDRKGLGYIARPTNVEPYPDVPQDFVPNTGVLGKDPEDAYDEGYYIGVINTADEMSRHLRLCFNCRQGGHYWADCTKPLKDSLKQAKEWVNWEIRENQEKQLNPNRGTGGKGAHAPQAMPVSDNTAKTQNWTLPDQLPHYIGMKTLACTGSTRLISEPQSSTDG